MKWLERVDTWVNKMSHLTITGVSIDEALVIMMDQIENKPNPSRETICDVLKHRDKHLMPYFSALAI
jgi:hypothetical protein